MLLNNHLRFTILYHRDTETDLARIVGFEVGLLLSTEMLPAAQRLSWLCVMSEVCWVSIQAGA